MWLSLTPSHLTPPVGRSLWIDVAQSLPQGLLITKQDLADTGTPVSNVTSPKVELDLSKLDPTRGRSLWIDVAPPLNSRSFCFD